MALFGRREEPARGITGSAAQVTRSNASDIQRLNQQWQARSLGYYDIVPEVWFAGQFYSRGLSKVRLFPAIRELDGDVQPTDDQQLLELWDRVQDPSGGRKIMQANYGRLRFLIGECYLLATFDADIGEKWEIVSREEITINNDGTVLRRKSDGGEPEKLIPLTSSDAELTQGRCMIYRLWRRHPRKSALADSPMRASLDVCEELVMLTLGIRARIRSRLSGAGILAIDADVTLPAADDQDDTDEDAFIRELGEHLMEPIGDEGSASAVVPYLMRIPTAGRKIADLIHHIQIHNPNEDFPERGMRKEAVERLATGLDLPAEVLLGLKGANHWTSWQIDEQSWELLEPTVQEMADDFAGVYLRAAAKAEGYANWINVCLGYDEAEIVTRPDRTKDAAQAHDRLAISDASYRAAGGWDDEDKPDEEEWTKRAAIKLKDPGMLPGAKSTTPQTDSKSPPEEPPAEPPAPTQPASMIVGAAEFGVERARELAGSRIRTRSKPCGPCQAAISGFPNSMVAAVLGPAMTLANAGETEELVTGVKDSIIRLLMRRGVDADVARRVGVHVEAHAADTLYLTEPPPLDLAEVLT